MSAPVFEARGLSVRLGTVDALVDIELSIFAGETVALIGESGSGKTTLLRAFNRLVEPTRGALFHHGKPLSGEEPIALRRRLGYVQQDGGLLPHWTVLENVGLVPRLLGWDAARMRSRAGEVLKLVGLEAREYGSRYPRQLSGGQRQRVAVARAMAADPDAILLDEPFGALDPITRESLQDEFRSWKGALGKTLLLVTHDLEEAFLLADRIAVLRAGRIEQSGTAEELLKRPATSYVERLTARHRRLREGKW
ncbi:MAG: ATP-binding cassette domain-containing protein [Candidatus Eisenbacteria bacterium]